MSFADRQESLQRFATAHSVSGVEQLLRGFADELECDGFIYAYRLPTSFTSARVVLFSGYPAHWLDRYWSAAHYAVDPVIDYCKRHVLPVTRQSLMERAPAPSRRMMDEASECGLESGISAPMHGPQGELGILSLTKKGSGRSAQASIARATPLVQLLAGHVHEAARRISGLGGGEPAPALSAREQDCLRWASDGKTSWEIAQILCIAERTVNFHIDNAVAKLKAVNRQHALAKAITLQALSPSPF